VQTWRVRKGTPASLVAEAKKEAVPRLGRRGRSDEASGCFRTTSFGRRWWNAATHLGAIDSDQLTLSSLPEESFLDRKLVSCLIKI
jgi:hypothetical protein